MCSSDLSNTIDKLWSERPALPNEKVFELDVKFAGSPRSEKFSAVRAEMAKKDADYYLISSLDDVAWLLNLRGRDVPNTPVFYAHVLLGKDDAILFVSPEKISADIAEALESDGCKTVGYGEIGRRLSEIEIGKRLLFDSARVSAGLAGFVPEGVKVVREKEITTRLKAVKNETEIKNIRNANIREGVMLTRLMVRLEKIFASGGALHEADVCEIINELRKPTQNYLGPGFETIAAYGKNAASMHYNPSGRGDEILNEGFLLIDTGAQYFDGTTDITRTFAVGALTDEMKRDFTLLLKGHIALASAIFLHGATGTGLDAFARAPLWANGMNYRSGTGHGIGFCLSVHEGPHGISQRNNEVKLEKGMLVTNEPGVYKEGRHGIRTENLLLVKELFKNDDGTFMGFEIITYFPIDLSAIDASLLTHDEIKFLNGYHANVFEILSPLLDEEESNWLKRATKLL